MGASWGEAAVLDVAGGATPASASGAQPLGTCEQVHDAESGAAPRPRGPLAEAKATCRKTIPGLLTTLASRDAENADTALEQLWTSLHHQGGTTAVGALAVPFMLRIAATRRPELRAPTFRLVAEIGRCQHMGDGPRDGLLQVAEEPLMIEDSTMCRVDWTIQAARHAVTDDLHLLLPLLADPAPELRSMTAYVLATASGDLHTFPLLCSPGWRRETMRQSG